MGTKSSKTAKQSKKKKPREFIAVPNSAARAIKRQMQHNSPSEKRRQQQQQQQQRQQRQGRERITVPNSAARAIKRQMQQHAPGGQQHQQDQSTSSFGTRIPAGAATIRSNHHHPVPALTAGADPNGGDTPRGYTGSPLGKYGGPDAALGDAYGCATSDCEDNAAHSQAGASGGQSETHMSGPGQEGCRAATKTVIRRRQISELSGAALEELESIDLTLAQMAEEVHSAQRMFVASIDASGLGMLKTRLGALHGRLDLLQRHRIDQVHTGGLCTGKDEARAKRRGLNKRVARFIEVCESMHTCADIAMRLGDTDRANLVKSYSVLLR